MIKQLGRARRGWGDNIKMVLQEVGRGCVGCIVLAQNRDRCWGGLVNVVMNLRVPQNEENFLTN